jgi:transposase
MGIKYLAMSLSCGERVFVKLFKRNGVNKYGITRDVKGASHFSNAFHARQHASRMSEVIMRQFEAVDAASVQAAKGNN